MPSFSTRRLTPGAQKDRAGEKHTLRNDDYPAPSAVQRSMAPWIALVFILTPSPTAP